MNKGPIGSSFAFRAVLRDVSLVAPVDCSVFLQGETGAGREVIAKGIHDNSRRSEYPSITVNCAAIPGGLLESELFGHQRGAFTRAVTKRIGRFQGADRETLFLDEIGDLPLELPDKLLRVLLERKHNTATSDTNRVVGGPLGAARRSGLPRTTLISRMRKLGISRSEQPASSWQMCARFLARRDQKTSAQAGGCRVFLTNDRTEVAATRLADEPAVVPVLLILTVVTGVLDAISLIKLGHVFTANMTGNVVFLGLAVGGAPAPSGLGPATAVAAFFFGAAIAGLLARSMTARVQADSLRIAVVTEGCLLFVAAAIAAAPGLVQDKIAYLIIAIMSLALGLRNATLVKLGIAELTTTVVTRTIAGLGADLAGAAAVGRTRLRPRVLSVVLTALGAAAGFSLVNYSLVLALVLCALAVVGTVPALMKIAAAEQNRQSHPR